ncbi:MAG: type IX secretion system sortase PorU, partial [Ignavibacteriaceae bacterium]
LVLIISLPLLARNEIKIISSSRSSLVVAYTPHYGEATHIKINNEDYIKINLPGGYYTNPEDWGKPGVPKIGINVGVPLEYGNTIRVLTSSSKEISGKIAPKPKMLKDKGLNDFVYELKAGYNSYEDKSELVGFGEYGIVRGIPVQTLVISPVSYNPSQNTIKIYTRIVFEVNFSTNQQISSAPADDFLQGAMLNYNVARYWSKDISSRLRKRSSVENSVLNTGKWVKFEAPGEGIYKITRSMLTSFGIDAGTVDPRTIKIYNNGGKMLPEDVKAPYPSDLQENAIIVKGEEDGKFDEGDYILFYGRGNDFWDYDTVSRRVKRNFNLYSDHNYYFITSGGAPGKRAVTETSLNTGNAYTQRTTEACVDWEKDKINIFASGRYFLGDGFSSSTISHTYSNKLDGRNSNYPINYSFRIVNVIPAYISVELYENSVNPKIIFSQNLSGYSSSDVYTHGIEYNYTARYTGDLPDNRSVLKFQVNANSSNTYAYLDYFEITYQKNLTATNDSLIFYSKDTTSVINYNLSGFSNSNIQVYDISDYANIKTVSGMVPPSGGEFKFEAGENSGKVSKYIAVGNDKYKTPENPEEISNQNLHGIKDGAQYIIITDKSFNEQANRLKNYRENESKEKLTSIVVDVNQIYNEFSGGALDVTGIRNFIKYAYDNWTIRPEYVLLFGDGNYDYKDIEGSNNNFVPPYETSPDVYHKYNEIWSYPMDDYYAMVDGDDNKIDLAIGRINIQSYENNTDNDLWRNLITVVADDGPAGVGEDDGPLHTGQAEYLANNIIPGSFNINKIYLAAYPTVITGVGRTKPAVNEAIIAAMNNGSLIVHYVGHGNEHVWAHETVFENSSSIPRLHNKDLFFLTVASCGFGYYDKTTAQCGAELLLLKANSGAIGVFSATRPVYALDNAALSYTLYNYLLGSKDSANMPITVGDAYFLTKVVRSETNDQKFTLFGDPALRLLIPHYEASIDSINGRGFNISKSSSGAVLSADSIQIKALSHTRIEGVIKKPDNTVWSNFNGVGIISVYDSERRVLLPQLASSAYPDGYPMTVQGGTIFRGKVSVTNGHFTSNFIVPKDISYQNQHGKIIVYFYNNEGDGLGYTDNITVGGTDSSVVNDGKGPDVEIYFDTETPSTSYLINPTSTLIVKLSDETGINSTGTGVGHQLEGILNDNISSPIDFTNDFTGDKDSGGKSGEIKYPFNDITPGEYKIEVKAWDVFNIGS